MAKITAPMVEVVDIRFNFVTINDTDPNIYWQGEQTGRLFCRINAGLLGRLIRGADEGTYDERSGFHIVRG